MFESSCFVKTQIYTSKHVLCVLEGVIESKRESKISLEYLNQQSVMTVLLRVYFFLIAICSVSFLLMFFLHMTF